MKNYAKVIGFILLLFFCSLQSNTLAEDSFSPGSGWQEIPAYGPELQFLADWQEVSSGNTADDDAVETFYIAPSGGTDSMQLNETSPITGSGSSDMSNMLSGLMGISGISGLGNMLGGLTGGTGGLLGNILGGLTGGTGGMGNLFGVPTGGTGNNISADELRKQIDAGTVSVNMLGQQYDDAREVPPDFSEYIIAGVSTGMDNKSMLGLDGPVFINTRRQGVTVRLVRNS